MTDWKIKGCVNLIPVGVTLHNDVTGQTLNTPTLYNPSSDEVFLLDAQAYSMSTSKEVVKAVKDFIQNVRSGQPEIEDVVGSEIWSNIRGLVGLAKTPVQEL